MGAIFKQLSKNTPWVNALTAVGALGIVCAGVAAWHYVANRHWHGPLNDAVVTSAGIVSIVGVSHQARTGSHVDYRLRLLRPDGDASVVAVIDGGEPRCAEFPGGRLWCRSYEALNLLDCKTLAIVSDWRDLCRVLPQLKPGLSSAVREVKMADEKLVVPTSDGRVWLLSAAPLQASEASDLNLKAAVGARKFAEPVAEISDGSSVLRFGQAIGGRQPVLAGGAATPSVGAATYLMPAFVPLQDLRGLPASLSGALVVHSTSLKVKDNHTLLTRVDAAGAKLWEADLGLGELRLTVLADGRIMAVGSWPDAAAIGLDPRTGTELWRRGL